MGMRNLVFLAVVTGGGLALLGLMFPPVAAKQRQPFDAARWQAPDFRAAVERLDASFQAQWKEAGLQAAPKAPPLALVRRLGLALAGRIPSLQELRQLEAQPEELALPWYVDHLLQDRGHADYFAERLARAYVGTEDGPVILFRRRRFVNWLSDQLLHKQPYDQIVQQLLTSEGLWTDQPATNFVTVTSRQPEKNQPDPERLAGRAGRAFLGVRLDCAQCHDHPFEPWTQADFRGLTAFFDEVHTGFSGIYDGGESPLPPPAKTYAPAVPFLPDLWVAEGPRRQQLARWVTHPRNRHFAQATVNRVWALLLGKPLVEPVDNVLAADPVPPALALLAEDFAAHGFDLQRLIRLIAASEVFQRDSAAPFDATPDHLAGWAIFPMTRLRPEQVVGGVLQAASLSTLDADAPLLVRFAAAVGHKEFVDRYGDTGEDEFSGRGGTIPQRLLMMNGKLVFEKTKGDLFNASTRLAFLAPGDDAAVRLAYLVVLTREPTPEEAKFFEKSLAGLTGDARNARMGDLFWTLLNTTEFAWNH